MSRDRGRSDDAAFEAESVYRRRQRAVAVSRQRVGWRLRRMARGTAKVMMMVLPVGFAAFLLGRYLLDSPRFALATPENVVLSGNHYVSQGEVAHALGAATEANVFRISLDQVRRQVESIPWVRSASVRRIYPDRLLVSVTERTPVAKANVGGALKLADAEGVLLDKPAEGSFDFPVLSGVEASMSAADRKARLALYLQFAQELKAQEHGAGWLVSEVNVSDDRDLQALLVQGRDTILVHFGNQDFGERYRTFLTLLPEVKRTTPAIDSVDLRYQGQIVVNPKDAKMAPPPARTPP